MIATHAPSSSSSSTTAFMNAKLSAEEEERKQREREERVAALQARLREWEGELQRKKNALSESGRKIVDPIFKDKKEVVQQQSLESINDDEDEDEDVELDIDHEVFIEYDVPVGEGSSTNNNNLLLNNSSSARAPFTSSDEPTIDLELAMQVLGKGPMRFSRNQEERSLQEQVESLSPDNRETYQRLTKKWNDRARRGGGFPLTNDWILRFARNNCIYNSKSSSSNDHNVQNIIFQEKKAWKAMRKFKKRYTKLTCHQLEDQLRTKTLFPVPGLKTADGHDMFYMKPSRYFPKETSTKTIINNLAYVMTTMLETKESNCRNGIGFIANMDDWAMKNFDVTYCFQYMMCLQGFMVPVKVELFLIVNPPSWFGAIWKIMKPMLAPSFRRKVKVILADKLPKYLQDGFEDYLPNEMGVEYGKADADAIVEDFITFRKYFELKTGKHKERNVQQQQHGDDASYSGASTMSGSESSGLSLGTFDTDDSSQADIPIALIGSDDHQTTEMQSSVAWGDGFSPKVAMRKSRDSMPDDASFLEDGTGWSCHGGDDDYEDFDDDGLDDAEFDQDLAIFGDVGW